MTKKNVVYEMQKNICRFCYQFPYKMITQTILNKIVEGYVYLFYINHGRSIQDLKYSQYLKSNLN